MSRKNILCFVVFIAVIAAFVFFLPLFAWSASNFDDINNQKINSGLGTLEFRVKLLKDISTDPHNHVLLLAVSSDLKEFYKVEIVEDQIIVWRDFGGCLRAAFSAGYNFNIGEWHNLLLTWNRESTRFFIDDYEIKKLGLYSVGDSSNALAEIRLGHEDSFITDKFRASAQSDIGVDSADQEFVRNSQCPNLRELINEPAQGQSRGILLRHFPDQKSLEKMVSYIALLPADFAGAIKSIVYVEDGRFPKSGEAGIADNDSGSIILKGSYSDNPIVFFHEAAHLYDYKLMINFGVPDDKSEWAAISGQTCYYGGGNMEEFARNFEKTKVSNAFLAGQGGQCPSEDLAIWVSTAYDYYLKNKSLFDMLDPSSAKYSEKNKRKLDFILRKGFISQGIYDKITSK